MPSSTELYFQYGEICALCNHFEPDAPATASLEKKIEEVISKSSAEAEEAMKKDIAAVYGKCLICKIGMLAGQFCECTDGGIKQFSLNESGLLFSRE